MEHQQGLSCCLFVCCLAACQPAVEGESAAASETSGSTSDPEPTSAPTADPTSEPTADPTGGSTAESGTESSSTGPGLESETRGADACDSWSYNLLVDDPSRSTAFDLASVAEGLVLGGSPTGGAVALRSADGGTGWTYSGFGGDDSSLSVLDVLALDEGPVVIGGRRSPLSGPEQGETFAWLAQLESDGSVAWQADFGRTNFVVWAHLDVLQHPGGGFVLSTTGADGELRTVRIEGGAELWSRAVPIGSAPIAINWSRGAMDILPSGDIVQLTSAGDGVRVVSTAAGGEPQWDETFSTGTWPQDIVALPGGDVFVLSYDEDETLLSRLDGEGTLLWERRYAYGPSSLMSAMAWDPGTGRLFVGGGTRGVDGGSKGSWERTWLLLLDDQGEVTWEFVGAPGTPSTVLDVAVDAEADRFVFTSHFEGLHLAEVNFEPCR